MIRFLKSKASRFASCCAAAGAAIILSGQSAQAALPDVGYDVTADVTSFGTALGTIVAAAVALLLAFLAIRKGVRWIRGV